MIPPTASAAFVADMEEVLEVYHRPRDAERPLVCLDESSKQLIVETRTPIPAKPGQPERHDYEYERNGVANLFMMFAPLEGSAACCGGAEKRMILTSSGTTIRRYRRISRLCSILGRRVGSRG